MISELILRERRKKKKITPSIIPKVTPLDLALGDLIEQERECSKNI